MPQIPDYQYKFHTRAGHDVIYNTITQDTANPSYYQYMTTDGVWYIMKGTRTSAVVVYTFTTPVSTSASTGWTNRASLTYTTFNGAFG